jgi:hypothetical protein
MFVVARWAGKLGVNLLDPIAEEYFDLTRCDQ